MALEDMILAKASDKLRILHSAFSSSLSVISCPNLRRGIARAEYGTATIALAVVKIAALRVSWLDRTSRRLTGNC